MTKLELLKENPELYVISPSGFRNYKFLDLLSNDGIIKIFTKKELIDLKWTNSLFYSNYIVSLRHHKFIDDRKAIILSFIFSEELKDSIQSIDDHIEYVGSVVKKYSELEEVGFVREDKSFLVYMYKEVSINFIVEFL